MAAVAPLSFRPESAGASSEPWLTRWARRGLTCTAIPLGAGLLLALWPLAWPLALALDLIGWRDRRGHTRALQILSVLLAAEALGLLAAGALWLLTRLPGGRPERYLERNRQLQARWVSVLFGALRRWLPLRLEVEGQEALASPGPLVILARHTSLADTLLPEVVVAGPSGRWLRYVLKRELLWDPCLDVVGQRLPNLFVDRAARDSAAEAARVGTLARGLGSHDAVLIYPEGTRFSPAGLARARARAAATGSREESELAASLRHVLPPHPGGTLALLEAAPRADVVLLAHTGLESLRGLRDLLAVPRAGLKVRVRLTRIPAAALPPAAERAAWLRELWAALDRWIAAQAQPPG